MKPTATETSHYKIRRVYYIQIAGGLILLTDSIIKYRESENIFKVTAKGSFAVNRIDNIIEQIGSWRKKRMKVKVDHELAVKIVMNESIPLSFLKRLHEK